MCKEFYIRASPTGEGAGEESSYLSNWLTFDASGIGHFTGKARRTWGDSIAARSSLGVAIPCPAYLVFQKPRLAILLTVQNNTVIIKWIYLLSEHNL